MIAKRLAKLESVLARPAEQPPVDMRPFHTQLDFLLAGADHKGIGRFAAASSVSVWRLWRLVVTNDRRKFPRLCGRLPRPFRTSVDDVAIEIWQAFIRDEIRHRMCAIGVPVSAPLCRVRPLQAV
jgi:hypothetical protein